MQSSHLAWLSAALRALKPGAPVRAFSGTRTFHRLAAAMVEAGFRVRGLEGWAYGSGFPKALNVGKAIDKAAGATRPVIGPNPRAAQQTGQAGTVALAGDRAPNLTLTGPATPAAAAWEGFGTALKPAWEPIVVADAPLADGSFPVRPDPGLRVVHVLRKPLSERNVADNCLRWGTGALNIAAGRIGFTDAADKASATPQGACTAKVGALAGGTQNDADRTTFDRPDNAAGRWPANLLLLHRPTCRCEGVVKVKGSPGGTPQPVKSSKGHKGGAFGNVSAVNPDGHPKSQAIRPNHTDADGTESIPNWICADDCPVGALDRQAGVKKSGAENIKRSSGGAVLGNQGAARGGEGGLAGTPMIAHGDTGAVSRFFFQAADYDALTTHLCGLIAPDHLPDCTIAADTIPPGTAPESLHGAILCGGASEALAVLPFLRPGAHLLLSAPADEPTGHTGACAAEDAGYEVRDCLAVPRAPGALYYTAKAPKAERFVHVTCAECPPRVLPARGAPRPGAACPTCSSPLAVEGHPTVKPVTVMRWQIRRAQNEAPGAIMDPFAGTGTTLVAAHAEGATCIGIERDPKYVAVAARRIGDASRSAARVLRLGSGLPAGRPDRSPV